VRRAPVAVAAALMVALAGCADPTSGTATPGDDLPATSTTTATTEPTTSESEPTGGGLADVDPCALVPQAAATSIGLTGGEPRTVGEARVCRYRHDGATLNESFTVSVEVFSGRGLADIVGTDIQPRADIGTHKVVSFVSPTGNCGVSIGVGDSARVDNTAVGGDQQQGCQLAGKLAAAVEPELP
jgi:uncharacterized protein DUF3558